MTRLLRVTLLLLVAMVTLGDAGRRNKDHGGRRQKTAEGSDCSPADSYGKCVPRRGDCGEGERDATCGGHTRSISCKIPCNWRKGISDCKYVFGAWEPCDPASNTRSRSGTLKKALFKAECQSTVKVSKRCSLKNKKPRGQKKSN